MFRLPGIVVAIIALAASAAGQGGPAQNKAGSLSLGPYIFETFDGQKVDAELGRLTVPENRGRPNGRTIEVAFVRFKSTSKNPGAPIVYLAGGPGGSGIGTAKGSRFPMFMAMREVADVIAYDQRGTGLSRPNLTCPGSLGYPLDRPSTREDLLKHYRAASQACAEHWRGQGVDLAAFNTNENADDLEDLRKALGAEKINLWSISYGTHLALAMIRRHESSVGKAILAGTEGPAHTLKLPSNIQEHLMKIGAAAAADPEASKLVPDLIALMKQVWERLEREPATVEVTDAKSGRTDRVTIGKMDMQLLTANAVGNEDAASFPAVYYAASKGDFTLPAKIILGMRRGPVGNAMSFMMDCASGVSPDRLMRIKREAKEALLEDLIDFPFPEVCTAWGSPDAGEAFRSPVRSGVPVLFISGTLDARTPVSNAEEVRKGFPNSRHLIIEGAVHSNPLFLSSPLIKDAMLAFLKGSPLPATRVTLPPFKFTPVGAARKG